MADLTPELSYLREPRLYSFSGEVFGSAYRLPILGAILELTPAIEQDTFYHRGVVGLLDSDPGNTLREIQRITKHEMIRANPDVSNKKTIDYVRLNSRRWTIVELALGVAKQELGFTDNEK